MLRIKWLAAFAALILTLGAVPALADEGEEPEATSEETPGGNSGLAMLLADQFGITEEEVLALLEEGLGFGEIFKLEILATVLGTDIETLLADAECTPEEDGEGEGEGETECDFGWGELKDTLTEEQLALLDGLPKNFGEVVSAFKKHHGRDDHQPEHAGGKPPWAGQGGGPNGTGDEGDEGGEGG